VADRKGRRAEAWGAAAETVEGEAGWGRPLACGNRNSGGRGGMEEQGDDGGGEGANYQMAATRAGGSSGSLGGAGGRGDERDAMRAAAGVVGRYGEGIQFKHRRPARLNLRHVSHGRQATHPNFARHRRFRCSSSNECQPRAAQPTHTTDPNPQTNYDPNRPFQGRPQKTRENREKYEKINVGL
jgi:hypothetical protein